MCKLDPSSLLCSTCIEKKIDTRLYYHHHLLLLLLLLLSRNKIVASSSPSFSSWSSSWVFSILLGAAEHHSFTEEFFFSFTGVHLLFFTSEKNSFLFVLAPWCFHQKSSLRRRGLTRRWSRAMMMMMKMMVLSMWSCKVRFLSLLPAKEDTH